MKSVRPPIVVVLGHVDHGKTSLLDALRSTRVAPAEAGGITQGIGASQIETKDGKKITFIDTPGHAAFTKMRSRGGAVADIAILVVAAEDGVKPQTKEAISIIKQSGVTPIVAITKIDLSSADPESVKAQVEQEEIYLEGRGGDTPVVLVSSKNKTGLDELLQTIVLVSEVKAIQADAEGALDAVVIETQRNKKGLLASVIVRDGRISVGDTVSTDTANAKVKGLFDDKSDSVKEILPGSPGQILGFSEVPQVGSLLTKGERSVASQVKKEVKIDHDKLNIYLKAQNAGSLEAVEASVPEGVGVLGSSVGEVNEGDLFMAKAAGARIFVFESKVPGSVAKLAETEGVKIERFEVIYELIQRLEEIIKTGVQEILGKAQILAIFDYDNKKVAGCKVVDGKITRSDSLILTRDEKEIGRAKIVSMRKVKQEITEAKAGEEFGIIMSPQLDFMKDDMLLSVAK